MKYMGSKRSMLQNGLGEAIASATPGAKRFIDLFTGSASVAWHVAQGFDVPVIASDLQSFAVVLANSVLLRRVPLAETVFEEWLGRATVQATSRDIFKLADENQKSIGTKDISAVADQARRICESSRFIITSAYGGFYFSPLQSIWLDSFRSTLPIDQQERNVCLAALIWAASRAAAAPGHTAQPFKPNLTAGRFLKEAWNKDVVVLLRSSFDHIRSLYSRCIGEASVNDANKVATSLQEGDLAFIDPPYSSVHYSRFYHVLETLTTFETFVASGQGRYPPPQDRPQSQYSQQKNSLEALQSLFRSISSAGASAIVTFPAGAASNGISGEDVLDAATDYFHIQSAKVSGRFSTMGGNRKHRQARMNSEELILTLSKKAGSRNKINDLNSVGVNTDQLGNFPHEDSSEIHLQTAAQISSAGKIIN
jgi:adenine-specific DNA methylase